MIIEDRILRAYLQAAHNCGGSYDMAMRMMASRLLILEDRLLRAGVDFPEDKSMGQILRAMEDGK